jgi:hypothetical protein
MAANATVPRTVTMLDKAANDRSARAARTIDCFISIVSTLDDQSFEPADSKYHDANSNMRSSGKDLLRKQPSCV